MSTQRRTGSDSSASAQMAGQDRRQRLQHTLDELALERQQVLVDYREFADIDSSQDKGQIAERLRHFCQDLIDYAALGHFELFERVIDGTERRQEIKDIAEKFYGPLARTTEAIVAFNDKYDGDAQANVAQLAEDIDQLGQVLAERIDIEDDIIKSFTQGAAPVKPNA